jgi:hypothetical protein
VSGVVRRNITTVVPSGAPGTEPATGKDRYVARRRVPGGSHGSGPRIDSVVEIRQNPAIDLKESGLALLYDPAVVTERVLDAIRARYREAEEADLASRPHVNPLSGEFVPARGAGPSPARSLRNGHDRLQFLHELAEPYVGRHALAFLDICGDELLSVLVRVTTGPCCRPSTGPGKRSVTP